MCEETKKGIKLQEGRRDMRFILELATQEQNQVTRKFVTITITMLIIIIIIMTYKYHYSGD